ncbi:MAG: hypothetical protein RLZZ330_1192 [Actinomycetota bacterium]|jgi:hypothetical protein
MKKVSRKIALLISFLLAAATLPAITNSASALPENVEIRLITPRLDDTNSWRDTDMEALWVQNNWFADGFTFRQGWAPAGSTIHFTYLVTNADTNEPLANTNVKLRVNKGYSVANSIVKVNGQGPTDGVDKAPLDQLIVTAPTDSFGFVTFTMESLDTQDMCGEPKPVSFTERGHVSDFDCNVSLYTQIYPELLGQLIDQADMTEIHYYKEPNQATYDESTVTARVATPVFTPENSVQRNDLETEFTVTNTWYPVGLHFFQKYAPASRKINLTYHFEDANGEAIAGQEVSLLVNKEYSNSSAKMTNGTTASTGAQVSWTATTDAFGNALFATRNTDVVGQPKPESLTQEFLTAGTGAIFSQMYPSFGNAGTLIADMVEFHYFTDPTAAKTAITVTPGKGKISVKVSNPHGKAVKVTIDGKKSTKSPAANKTSVTYTFKAKKGKHSVVVICNGVKKTVKATVK